jgi:hypothetical protein
VRQPVIEFPRRFLCVRWISISSEDRVLLRIGHAARSLSVRYTRERCVHSAGGQFRVGNRAEAAGLVDVYFSAVLGRGEARRQQECHGDQDVCRRHFDHWGEGRCYVDALGFVRSHTSRSAATTADTSGTGSKSTREGRRGKFPQCRTCSKGGRNYTPNGHPCGATNRRAGTGCAEVPKRWAPSVLQALEQ